MKILSNLLIVLFLMVSCTSNTIYEKPKNLLSKNKMADILTDMYIAEGARSVNNKNLERLVDYMPLVYEKHQIDSVQFAESNFYYNTRIDDYEAIYKMVDQRLKNLHTKYDTIIKKADSINRSKLYRKRLPEDSNDPKRIYPEEEEDF
jgi:hypothetical protein